jgi:hypothetical protein
MGVPFFALMVSLFPPKNKKAGHPAPALRNTYDFTANPETASTWTVWMGTPHSGKCRACGEWFSPKISENK